MTLRFPLLLHVLISVSALTAEAGARDNTSRYNDPADYIAFLKKTRFKEGQLDHLPSAAIILHSTDPDTCIKAAGGNTLHIYETGISAPNRLIVAARKNGTAYLVNVGLPGAGGIATQVAELGALGVKRVVHIGTCGQMGGAYDEKTVLVSTGSYKDAAAVLLSDDPQAPFSTPDGGLSGKLTKTLLRRAVPCAGGLGFTIPIYYYQPAGLMIELLGGEKYAAARPLYMEMEEAAFYESSRRAGVKAASLVVPSDMYRLKGAKLTHEFTRDPMPAVQEAFKAAVDALESE